MAMNKPFSFTYWIRKTGASLFFLGYIPYIPGTVGSAVATALVWYVHQRWGDFLSPEKLALHWVALIAITAISIFLSSRDKDVFGSSDPSQIIIDEVAGQLITFFMIPISLKTLLLGFLLFRFYDIVKPFPVYQMQELEEGVGVTMDDVVAGVLANVSLMIILAVYGWVKGYL